MESPQFKIDEEQQTSSQERGFLPDDVIQERGEEEDKVPLSPIPKRMMRKKGFREISVSDIMPNLKSKLLEMRAAEMPRNSIGFIGFSKQFSHFVIHPIFLSYIEVSDYLEIRKGCVYLWNWYDYNVLEDLVKFGNLNSYLRRNLWLSVTPYDLNQRKYREILRSVEKEHAQKLGKVSDSYLKEHYEAQSSLDLGSVFDNVYSKVLEKAETLEYLVNKVEDNVSKFKILHESNPQYEPDDFEVLSNLAVSYNFLFPESANDKLEYLDALFQGSSDEEVAFWILLWISESTRIQRISEFRKSADREVLKILTKKYCANFYKIMNDTHQLDAIWNCMIENFGWQLLPYTHSLSIIDCYLVSSFRGFYERVIIIFMHIEDFINKSFEEGNFDSNSASGNSNDGSPQSVNSQIKNKDNRAVNEHQHQLISVREFFSNSNNEFDQLTLEELNFKSFVDWVKVFNKAYNIKITEDELQKVQKEALRDVLDTASIPAPDSIVNQQKYAKMKFEVNSLWEKHLQDMQIIDRKSQNIQKHIDSCQKELAQLYGTHLNFIYFVWSLLI